MKRALVLSLICVLGLGFSSLAASLTGSWDTDVTIDPTQTSFAAAIGLTSNITVNYKVGDWTFTSLTKLTDAGWIGQQFGTVGVLGAFSLGSTLIFDPGNVAFSSWQTTASVSIAGVSFGANFLLGDDPATVAVEDGTMLTLSASGVAGDVSVGGVVTLGDGFDCDFDFSSVVINVGFPFCCADISAEIAFDCTGFNYVSFGTTGIAVPSIPWLSLDALVKFTVNEKTLTLTPNVDFGDIACFSLDLDIAAAPVTNGPLTIGDITINGIGLTCTIGDTVTFTGYTDYTGTSDYYEWYKISTANTACCGPFSFDLGFYFNQGGSALFDLGMIDANMTLQVATQFAFNMGLKVDVDAGAFTLWTVGFLVTW